MGSCQNTFLSFFEAKILKVERPLNIVLCTSIVGAFSLGFRPQTAMGSAAATASIADLTPSCNTSYYTAQQPTDAKCKSLSWVKINLDEAFLFYSFIRNSSLHVSSTYYN